jgi:hypothetical protein
MKTFTTLLITLFFIPPMISFAQSTESTDVNNSMKTSYQNDGFQLGIQNFALGEIYTGRPFYAIEFRAGYQFKNNNLVFLHGRFAENPRYGISRTIEAGINYRRYFGHAAFQPFVQSGVGIGRYHMSEDYYVQNFQKYYGTFNTAGGVSFTHKRWRFEVGLQADYNRDFSGRVNLRPLWGVSFSF